MTVIENHEHPTRWRAWLQPALLLGMGFYFVYTIASGHLPLYINVSVAWLSYLAAGMFLLLGGVRVYGLLRHDEIAHEHHDHEHKHGDFSWTGLLIVAIPLLLGTLIPARDLPPQAANGNVGLNAVAVNTSTTVQVAPLDRNILDWLREFNRATTLAAFDGQPADVIGFVYREPDFAPGQFMVARFAVSCCIADASAIGLPVSAPDGDSLPDSVWVRVQGTFQVGTFRGGSVPILQAATVEQIDLPEQPYLYP